MCYQLRLHLMNLIKTDSDESSQNANEGANKPRTSEGPKPIVSIEIFLYIKKGFSISRDFFRISTNSSINSYRTIRTPCARPIWSRSAMRPSCIRRRASRGCSRPGRTRESCGSFGISRRQCCFFPPILIFKCFIYFSFAKFG